MIKSVPYSNQSIITFNMHDLPAFKTANEFSMFIEKKAVETKMTHLEVVLQFCEEHMIDPADIASKINKSLKQKIESDFRELNYLPKQAQLDI